MLTSSTCHMQLCSTLSIYRVDISTIVYKQLGNPYEPFIAGNAKWGAAIFVSPADIGPVPY